MKTSDIKSGCCYSRMGKRGIKIRMVTNGWIYPDGHIETTRESYGIRYREIDYKGRESHGSCSLRSFAEWAEKEVPVSDAMKLTGLT